MDPIVSYRGRFAPSPTGPLHFGSLVAAMASYLDARHHRGLWLLRIEDVDETRAVTGAGDDIQRSLETLGFEWDETVRTQSERKDYYSEILNFLKLEGLAYDCGCTRSEIASVGKLGVEGPIYPGICRSGLPSGKRARTIRFHAPGEQTCFEDRIYGRVCQRIASELGDFVIRRADGYTAYQLAVVLDDADQNITHVVRGADLLMSTPRQMLIQQALGLNRPEYAHVPLVLDAKGQKLSKREKADPIVTASPLQTLMAAYRFLQQDDGEPHPESLVEFWPWAIEQWTLASLKASIKKDE